MNWNILVVSGSEINREMTSSGERKLYEPFISICQPSNVKRVSNLIVSDRRTLEGESPHHRNQLVTNMKMMRNNRNKLLFTKQVE